MGRPFLRPPLRPLLRPVQHPLLLALSRALLLAALWGAASAGALTPAAQAPGAAASANGAATAPPPDITELQAQLAKLATTADTDEDARALVAQVEAISAGANRLISARTSQLNDLNARLTELGDAPAAGTTEDPDITRQRASLTKQRNAIDADIRLARLVTVDARQRGTEVLSKRQKVATDRLLERSDSPLSGAFWTALAEAWPSDLARLQPLNDELRQGWARAATPGNRGAVLFTLLATLAGVLLANVVIERSLVRLCQRVLPRGRLRRSLLVIAVVGLNVLVVAVLMHLAVSALGGRGVLPGPLTGELASVFSGVVVFMACVVSLGRALLAVDRPSWRLPPIPDATAQRLRPFPLLIALAILLTWLPGELHDMLETSRAWAAAADGLSAAVMSAVIAALLVRLRGPRPLIASGAAADEAPPAPADAEGIEPPAATGTLAAPGTAAATAPEEPERPLWVALLLAGVAVVLIAIWAMMALGYLSLASTTAGRMTWSGIVIAAFYVLFKFADDLFMGLFSAKSGFGQRLQKSFGFAPSTLNQAAVVLSALARLALFFYMVIALVEPLGTDPAKVVQRTGEFSDGVKIGEFQLVPSAIFTAVGVLVGGFIALRVARRWLLKRYLPTTAMEPGMQSSITTLLGYAGGILVVALALSALGIGVNRIAWIASALSVGIGFGLQAIVQNFISGLILLAERPVKVGDWVSLGGTEGDVRRISVRATEIALGDRSTVIVPNSEFITKTVRNMTLANAEGRVLIRLPMPLESDPQRVRDVILAACSANARVLTTPGPSLTLEGIENGQLIFQAIAYVPGPRLASSVKSELLFTILADLREAGLPLSTTPSVVIASPPPPAGAGLA